ncbi:Flp family type IVb pilin [Dongia sp.]|uniref:Flp family type IVb pilin n=1 Tax=Dongia sp. TaxID=1977262 RepID=UPI003753DEF0
MMTLLGTLAHYRRSSMGATAIEYALIAGLVAVVLVPGLFWVKDLQQRLSNKLDAATGQAQIRDDIREPVHKVVKDSQIRDDNRAPVHSD